MVKFSMKFPLKDIKALSGRYTYATDVTVLQRMQPVVRARGHMTKADLVAVGQWKSPRAVPKIATNDEGLIVEATRIALSTPHERLRLLSLTTLYGVGYPMASVILHWFHSDKYPILDFRALWSLGVEKPAYSFDNWMDYVHECRRLAGEAGCDMRTLDRALWQYSSEKQPPKTAKAGECE